MATSFTIEGILVLPAERRVVQGAVVVRHGMVEAIIEKEVSSRKYIMPGLVDAHVHIESSMLIPAQFARAAVVHGTTTTVSDPHEIANVLGVKGVEYMIRNGATTPFRFYFGAPSCVPATPLETSGAVIDAEAIGRLLDHDEIVYLAEMMNFPGVIFDDPEVLTKLGHAQRTRKPVDGHAPGLSGDQLRKYIGSGITTDHECFSLEEAREKAILGMKILIREGSAAKNFEELIPLIAEFPDQVMFCSDDKHPDDLVMGHINTLLQRGTELGYPLLDLLRACTVNPVEHYGLSSGLLRKGDPADFIVISDINSFSVEETYIAGERVAAFGKPLFEAPAAEAPNHFLVREIQQDEIAVRGDHGKVKVIGALDGQLITQTLVRRLPVRDGLLLSDPEQDILKLVVVNRYIEAPPAVAFIHGFGLRRGALASTVAHDSHNIIAIGSDDTLILKAIDMLMETKGGLCAVNETKNLSLDLPVAGIMSDKPIHHVAAAYEQADRFARELGTTLTAPFMTLSFMALLVIPELKLGDKGLFDGLTFRFTDLLVKD
jgi:adenine deaminase